MTEDTLNDTERLTEEERAERRCNCDFCYWDEHYTRAAVEAIVAARTAALARDRDALAAKVEAEALEETARELWRVFLRLPHTPSPFGDYIQRRVLDIRARAAALAGPEDTARVDASASRFARPLCPDCGPGYRVGDPGCRHTPEDTARDTQRDDEGNGQ